MRLLSPAQIPKVASLLAKNALGQPAGPEEFTLTRKNGSKVSLEIRTFPVKVNGRNLVLGIARDVNKRGRAREELQASEEKYRNLADNITDVLIQIDLKGKINYVSKSFESMSGYSREEVEGKNIKDFLIGESYQRTLERMRKWMAGEREQFPYEVEVKGKDGRIIPVEIHSSPVIEDDKLKAIQVTARDITARRRMEEELRANLKKFQKSLRGTVFALTSLIKVRDPYTASHQRRVKQLCLAIAKEMGLSEKTINALEVAAAIHDIGKIYVPAEILTKPDRLSKVEFAMIREHPKIGYDILKEIEFPWPVAKIVLQHHERMDGSGYPQGLSGEDIILEARILAVADVVEAMSSHRPYRAALGIRAALEEISKHKGLLYDPEVVDACLRVFKEEGFSFE